MDISQNRPFASALHTMMNENNATTLEYLTNPLYHTLISNKNKTEHTLNNDKKNDNNKKEEIRFYRKRIVALTKEMVKGDMPTTATLSLKKAYEDYAREMVMYFKMVDTRDIIQQEYTCLTTANNNSDFNNLDDSLDPTLLVPTSLESASLESASLESASLESASLESASLDQANEQMMRKIVNVSNNLDNYVIKKKNNENSFQPILPLKKEINLFSPALKTKGIIEKEKKKIKPKTNKEPNKEMNE